MPRGQLVRMAAGATKSFCKPNILVLGCRIRPACGKLFVGKWIMVCFLSLRTEPDEQHLNSVPFFPSFLASSCDQNNNTNGKTMSNFNLNLPDLRLHFLHYAFSRCFYPKRLTVQSGYTFVFYQYACSLGIENCYMVK